MWQNTTHDWATSVDRQHLAAIRTRPERYAPTLTHLILEVMAYPADEALATGAGRCLVVLHRDGSVSVRDEGRGTDTRRDADGVPVKKPVMATKDLRFFDDRDAPLLTDGLPRRGMSVVAALSSWLVHTNWRQDGAWTQRYQHGVPVTDLLPIEGDGSTGTTVHFLADPGVRAADLTALRTATWPAPLTVEFDDQRRL